MQQENPRVVDDDRDQIMVLLGVNELRSWRYASEYERREKMRLAREYVEGFLAGRAQP